MQSKGSNKLEKWINSKYLQKRRIKKLRNEFINNSPYPYLELRDFLIEGKAKRLLIALSKERFYQKESDLFSFYQTNDISSLKNEKLQEFRSFLCSPEFISYIQSLTGLKLKAGKADLSGTLYKNTNYLLCHDDELEGRSIAFLLYLSDLQKADGGSLNMLNRRIKAGKKLYPKFNNFTFFRVSNISFHEVEEVVKDRQRIALGGWLHDK